MTYIFCKLHYTEDGSVEKREGRLHIGTILKDQCYDYKYFLESCSTRALSLVDRQNVCLCV